MTETYMRETKVRRKSEIDILAEEIHKKRHHKDSDGPCWGPTLADREEAKRRMSKKK